MALQQISGSQIQSNTTITVDTVVGNVSANNITSGTLPDARLGDTAVTPGSYGNSSQIATFTVDQKGRLTAAGQTAVAGVSGLTYTSANATLTVSTSAGSSYEATIDLASFDTDDIAEGTNQYYTDARARGAVSVTDSGGDGSLSYNSTSGVFTYTGPSASEVRAHFSAGTGVTLSSGQISIGQAVATSDSPTFTDLTVSGNLTVSGTTTTVSTQNLLVNDGVLTLNNGQSTPVNDSGFIVQRYATANSTQYNVGLIWDETNDMFEFVTTTEDGSDDAISVVDSLMAVAANGFVGIGTTSPSSALDIVEIATSAVPLRLTTAGGPANSVRNQISMFSGTAVGYHIATIRSNIANEPYGLAFVQDTTERMRIDSSGNLLVGTTSTDPRNFSSATYGIRLSDSQPEFGIGTMYINRSTGTDGDIISFRKDGTTVGSIGVGNSSSYIYIGTGDTGLMFNSGNDFIQPWNPSTNGSRDSGIDLGNAGNRFRNLYLSGTAIASLVTVDGTGTSNFTSTATAPVQINGASIPTLRVNNTAGSVQTDVRATTTEGVIRTASNDPLDLGTNQTSRMRLQAAGNINIGDSLSTLYNNYKVVIRRDDASSWPSPATGGASGEAVLALINDNTSSFTYSNLVLRAGSGDCGIAAVYQNAGNNSDLVFYTDAGVNGKEQMRLTHEGYVGIGQTNPTYTLDVTHQGGQTDVLRLKGVSGNAFIRFEDSDTTSHWSFGVDDGSGAGANALIAYDRINSQYRLVLDNNGNVGIGTVSPSNVSGYRSLHLRGSSGSLIDMGASGKESRIVADDNGLGFQVTPGTHTHQNIRWKAGQINSATDGHMILLENGNVGIGTTSPEQELDVAGQILIQPTGVTSGTTDTARKLGFRGVDSTYSEYVEDFVQTNNNQQSSGTTSHWFAIKSYSRYQSSSSQGGMMNVKIIKNADHATRCHYYEYMLFQGTGSGGSNSSTSGTSAQLWDVAAKQLGWNYYGLTVTPTFYRPDSGLTITNYYEERYPLLLKVEVSGNSNYNREIGVAVSGYMGRLYRLSGEALEYLGSSTPADFTGNYAAITSSGAWL